MIATTVPVTIDADAAEYADRHRLRSVLNQLIEHALQTISHLQRLAVVFPPSYEYENDMIVIEAYGPWSAEELRIIEEDHFRWVFATFAPEEFRYFLLLACPDMNNESAPIS